MLTVGLYTLGCKVSQYETEAIAERFASRGYEVRPFTEACDVYVINTCTVTRESDRKSRQIIGRAKNKNPNAIIAVLGCYTQRTPEEVEAMGGISIILGTQDKLSVVDRVDEMLRGIVTSPLISVCSLENATFEPMRVSGTPRTRAYVKIEDGCESRCTYCAIADARGRVRSKPRRDVIDEVESLARLGTQEIVLTGIETGSYGRDLGEGYGLGDLIRELSERGSCSRIRLGSLAPELVGSEFAEKIRGVKILAPHFHISMQSGSDKILRSMKRRYNTAMAEENMARLRECFPTAQFTTDLMVGFPGESEEDFMDTMSLVDRVGFLDAHVFAYSKRIGTPAASYPDQVLEHVKKQRSERLISEVRRVRDRVLDEVVLSGKALSCILETYRNGVYTAHSEGFVEVELTAEDGRQGEMVMVLPVSHKNGIVQGKIL